LLGSGDNGWVCSVGEGVGGVRGVEVVAGKAMGTMGQRVGKSWEGPVGVWVVNDSVGSPGRTGQWAARQNCLSGRSRRHWRFVPCVLAIARGQEVGYRW